MSPKPVDPRRALETLRGERPSPEAALRVRAALEPRSPTRRSLARPLAAAMIATALAVVVLTPRTHAGAAWAQTLARTADVPAVHSVSHWGNGRTGSESWRSGAGRATVLYRENGEVQMELRTDGRRTLDYFDWAQRTGRPGPNERRFAVLSRGPLPPFNPLEIPLGQASVLLASPDVQVIGHETPMEGRPETYHLRRTLRSPGASLRSFTRDFDAEVDATTHRVSALVTRLTIKGRQETIRTEIDYPASVPASVFEPKVQLARGVQVYDIDAQTNAVGRGLRQGLGRSGPVTLRAVLLDYQGELWVYWSGAPTGHPFDVRGVTFSPGAALVGKGGLSGMARIATSRVGETVDLDVPYRNGVARFRRVPVLRTGSIGPFQGLLEAKRDGR